MPAAEDFARRNLQSRDDPVARRLPGRYADDEEFAAGCEQLAGATQCVREAHVVERCDERDQVVARWFGRHVEELVNVERDVVEHRGAFAGPRDHGRVRIDSGHMTSDAGEALPEQTLAPSDVQDATRPPASTILS